jgi:hypothetical protein
MHRSIKLIVVLTIFSTAVHCQQSLLDAFSQDGFRFPQKVSEKSQIFQFESDTTIGLSSQGVDTKQGANYKVSLYPHAKLADEENQYFLGWVDQYTSTEGKTV